MKWQVLSIFLCIFRFSEQQSCGANTDFSVLYDGLAAFTVSQANGTCLCAAYQANSLLVSGAATLGTVAAGPTTLLTLAVSGSAMLGAVQAGTTNVSTLAVSGPSVFGPVTATTMSVSALTVSGISTFGGGIGAIAGTLSVNTPISVSGANSFTVGTGTATFNGPLTANGIASFTSNQASSSTTTGAVVVTGGVGIGGAVNIGGAVSVSGALQSAGVITSGSASTRGGWMATGPKSPSAGFGPSYYVQRDYLQWSSTNAGGTCAQVHLKTNIKNAYAMYRFLVEGYVLEGGLEIFSSTGGYTYSSTGNAGTFSATQTFYQDRATGASLLQYISSDQFLVIRVTLANVYYSGFSVSSWMVNPHGLTVPMTLVAYNQCTNL
eukprot:TRINITY_DN6208_c1_g2_i2.p1 TRINITY_DN6208_c1_g2~~TRINITY_DN6208_c1_g2_i2.p1  ORF type:complete len:379 (+),score=69.28 TRINITY_DN6208_c1_g2_i2:114-1250(+)